MSAVKKKGSVSVMYELLYLLTCRSNVKANDQLIAGRNATVT